MRSYAPKPWLIIRWLIEQRNEWARRAEAAEAVLRDPVHRDALILARNTAEGWGDEARVKHLDGLLMDGD